MNYLLKSIAEIYRAASHQPLSISGTIVTIFLAMLMPGIFWIAGNNLSRVEQKLKEDMTIDVFLKEGTSDADIEKLRGELLKLKGVTGLAYYSKRDALFRMRESFGQNIIRDLEENPLPASFSLEVEDSILKPGAADSLIATISDLKNVEEVVFARDILSQVSRITGLIKKFGIIIAILVILSGIFISANTVRVAIIDRREVVEIMQIVGATRNYILTPFVLLGGILGLVGTVFSSILLWLITRYFSESLAYIRFLNGYEITAFILAGLLLGMLGSLLATRKYLEV